MTRIHYKVIQGICIDNQELARLIDNERWQLADLLLEQRMPRVAEIYGGITPQGEPE